MITYRRNNDKTSNVTLALMNYHKAPDTIEKGSFLEALKNTRIDYKYSMIIRDIWDVAAKKI